jgi:hypothetical protein
MRNKLILIIMLLTLIQVSAAKSQLSYRPYFSTIMIDDDQVSARVFATGLDLNYKFSISETLTSIIRGGVLLETGSNNSLNLKEFAPDRELILYQANLRFRPNIINILEVDLGSLSLSRFHSPLLLGQSVFMGLNERIKFGGAYNLQLEAVQSIPNNQNLARRSGGIEEGTPSFLMERASLNLSGDLLSFSLSVSHFKFNNLSAGVADQSRFMGNDIGGSATSSYFIYDFDGHNSTFNLAINQSGYFKFNITGEYLFNSKAPNGQNTGYLATAILAFGDYGLGLDYFRNEKNASPAYYNSKYYGHNNKKGIAGHISIKKCYENFDFKMRAAQFDVIDLTNILISKGFLVGLSLTRSFSSF